MTNPVSEWPTNADVMARLQLEAGSSAVSLGHALTSWSPIQGRASTARCTRCGDIARILVRAIGRAAVQGPAAHVRCTGSPGSHPEE